MKRKVVAILLCGSLVFSTLTACGSAKETAAETTNTVEESNADTEAAEKAAKEAEEKAAAEAAAKEAEEAYEAGRACFYGLNGQKKDLEAACDYFEKALESGKTEANFYLGAMYDWEGYPEQDYEKARAYYEAAGENPYAYISLGYNYYYGQGVEADQAKGKEYFEKAVELGCMDGYLGLASIAENEEDYATAMEDYNLAAEKGTEPLYVEQAMIGIGSLYRDGLGVEQDGEKAVEWFEKVAEAGDSDGYNYIGVMYHMGNGVEPDYVKAMEWYEKGAELENITSMANIGVLHRDGLGVEQDGEKAVEWFTKAALAGDSSSCDCLGMIYLDENGVEQDYTKAVEWFEKGAELGSTYSMRYVGELYSQGNGVEQDYAKAREWFEKGYELGDAMSALDIAAMLRVQGLDGVEEIEWLEKAYEAAEQVNDSYTKYVSADGMVYIYTDGAAGVEPDAEKAAEWSTKKEEALQEYLGENSNN